MMSSATGQTGVAVLSREECFRLLRDAHIGRVAVHAGALPAIFPVNFVLTPGGIVFRTDRGTKLAAATSGAVVAFEIDGANPMYHAGWSVMVIGTATEIVERAQLDAARRLPLRSWGSDSADHYVRIATALITGRRIRNAAASAE